ncbi:unnamed protein product [Trichobilharzia regenti]|nr:unnamed protein product [Trichobilharzia regenti]
MVSEGDLSYVNGSYLEASGDTDLSDSRLNNHVDNIIGKLALYPSRKQFEMTIRLMNKESLQFCLLWRHQEEDFGQKMESVFTSKTVVSFTTDKRYFYKVLKNNGRPCFINGTWIPHSGVHGDGCPHQCTCIDGITLCHNLCSHIEAKRPPDELCNHIYNDGTTMRLQLMPPRQGECCKRWMCLRVPFSHPPGKGVYVNWKKESNYTEVKEIHGSHNQGISLLI